MWAERSLLSLQEFDALKSVSSVQNTAASTFDAERHDSSTYPITRALQSERR